jgi:hypothetical protein
MKLALRLPILRDLIRRLRAGRWWPYPDQRYDYPWSYFASSRSFKRLLNPHYQFALITCST